MVNAYPKGANFDDQVVSRENVLFDIFIFSSLFHHFELSEEFQQVDFEDTKFELQGKDLFINGKAWDGTRNFDTYTILRHEELNIVSTLLPKETLVIDASDNSAIHLNTQTQVVLEAKLNSNFEIESYFLRVDNADSLYFNGQKVSQLETEFKVGDCFILDGVAVERRLKQFKLTGITQDLDLNPYFLIEMPFLPEYPKDFPDYRRSPRIIRLLPDKTLEISAPETLPDNSKSEIIRTILPPFVMVAASVVTSVVSKGNPIMMVSMGAMSVVTIALSVSAFFTNKKKTKEKAKQRAINYEEYLITKQTEINELENEQRASLDYHYPDMDQLAEMAIEYNPRIYEKVSNNEDFLKFSLGLGEVLPSYKIHFDSDERTKDELTLWTKEEVIEPRQLLKDSPISTSLQGQTLGFVGIYPVLKTAITTLLLQIAMFHSYHDVEFIALVPEESYEKDWRVWRLLPHFQIESLKLRGLIYNAQTRDMVLNSFLRLMNNRRTVLRESGNEEIHWDKHFILTILDDSWLSGHGLNEFLAEDMSPYGVTVIWGKESHQQLPETVSTSVRYYSSEAGEMINENRILVSKQFKPYRLPQNYPLKTVINHLVALNHTEVEKNAIPEQLGFLELYKAKTVEDLNIEERWAKADTSKTLSVPLGLRGKDDVVELNLHEKAHGPHGLVAGTTGSGKSETLQSYLLSLAVNFSPEDVGFLPIDFKGGGMANEFKGLPHMLGSITNLDGASSARALASIHAELMKRQSLFTKYGVNHINGYTKLYKAGKQVTDSKEKKNYPTKAIPHLFLISDEFAELKQNQPDFMSELVTVARIGRSLGVHLILATQKPSGVVDDQIWSNSRFKLALKVADEADSNEILKTPDAAHISQVGRAYLQVGNNEIYELFQSAYSGVDYEPNVVHTEKVDTRTWLINDLGQGQLLSTDLSKDDEDSQVIDEEKINELHAVVKYIKNLSEEKKVILPDKPWLPSLEEIIQTPEIHYKKEWKKARDMEIPLALLDIPSQQKQEVFDFDFEKQSHTALYGSAGFGKSTALQTLVMNLARKNTPEQVQFNLLDFGTNGLLPLKDLPHVADIARLEDEEKLIKFLNRIRQDIAERKEKFAELGVASLSQYEAKSGKSLPILVTIIDAFDSLKDNPLEDAVESVVNQLLRDGSSVGMYLFMTALRADSFKISMRANIPTNMTLFLVEETGVRDIIGREALIAQEIIGRGQIKLDDPLAFQFYLAVQGENDLQRLNAMEKEVREMANSWKGARPNKIPMLPRRLSMADFYKNEGVISELEKENIPIALSMETTEVVAFHPEEDGYFLCIDNEPAQTEFEERILFEDLKQLEGKYQRIVFDAQERFKNNLYFDTILHTLDYQETFNNILSEISSRMDTHQIDEKYLIYIPDVVGFASLVLVEEDQVRRLLQNGKEVGIYVIFQSDKNKLDNSFDEISKYLRTAPNAGLIGSRLADQAYVKGKTNYSESVLEPNQSYYFKGRYTEKIKLISE